MTFGGLLKFAVVRGVDYHNHVTEWGVHWSFFCTLGVLNILGAFVRTSKFCLLYGFLILIGSELMSIHYDRPFYLYHAPRKDIFSANKEGILSISGYFAISLIGIGIGSDIYKTLIYTEPSEYMKQVKTKEGIAKNQQLERKIFFKLVGYSILFLIASELSLIVFGVPSRRLCNMSYVLYQVFIMNSAFTAIFFAERITLDHSNPSMTIDAINMNQLCFFVGSNLLIGLFNLKSETLHLSAGKCYLLMLIYIIIP